MEGEIKAFDKNWKTRKESYYTHWTRSAPVNQVQLAFRNHWTLFNELFDSPYFNKGKKVLEVGCGRGSLSCYFSDAGYDCTLLDISEEVINIAKVIFNQNKLDANFVVADATSLPFEDQSFDISFSIGLLEHFQDIKKPIKEQIRILKKGGIFIGYVVPHYTENIQKKYEWINKILKPYYDNENTIQKETIFRSDNDSSGYLKILAENNLSHIQSSGVYPLPMISHSIEFPFSLMPKESELAIVDHFQEILQQRKNETMKHPWLCNEGEGQAFLIWGYK